MTEKNLGSLSQGGNLLNYVYKIPGVVALEAYMVCLHLVLFISTLLSLSLLYLHPYGSKIAATAPALHFSSSPDGKYLFP